MDEKHRKMVDRAVKEHFTGRSFTPREYESALMVAETVAGEMEEEVYALKEELTGMEYTVRKLLEANKTLSVRLAEKKMIN